MSYSHECLAQAVSEYRAGNHPTIRAAANSFAIPYSTLKDHVNKHHKVSSLSDRQRLSPDQEQCLVNWISKLAAAKNPLSHVRVREMAQKILQSQGDSAPLGHQWVNKPHTTLATPLESARIEGASNDAISKYYNLFYEVKRRLEIEDEDVWNVDEVGMALGICSNSTVIAPITMKKAHKKAPQTHEWVTVIEPISMSGRKICPLVIIKGEDLQSSWFEEKTPNFV